MKLYLDDERPIPEGYDVLAKNAKVAIEILRSCYVHEVSLDHDLGEGDVGNGYEVICFIEEMAYLNSWWNVPVIHIHTANPAARIKMQKALENIAKIVANR